MSTTNTSLMTQALDATSSPVTIVDVSQPDAPIIYCNKAFTALTEYDESEIIGRNCRFLQGEDTDQKEINKIRNAIKEGKDATVTILNYTKSGRQFWNDLQISPIFDEDGMLTYFMGFQNDISERLEKNTVELIQKKAEYEVDMSLAEEEQRKRFATQKETLLEQITKETKQSIALINELIDTASDAKSKEILQKTKQTLTNHQAGVIELLGE